MLWGTSRLISWVSGEFCTTYILSWCEFYRVAEAKEIHICHIRLTSRNKRIWQDGGSKRWNWTGSCCSIHSIYDITSCFLEYLISVTCWNASQVITHPEQTWLAVMKPTSKRTYRPSSTGSEPLGSVNPSPARGRSRRWSWRRCLTCPAAQRASTGSCSTLTETLQMGIYMPNKGGSLEIYIYIQPSVWWNTSNATLINKHVACHFMKEEEQKLHLIPTKKTHFNRFGVPFFKNN